MPCASGVLLGALIAMLSNPQPQEAGRSNPGRELQEVQTTSDRVSATVEGPARIRAGETASFTFTLSPPPSFEGGHLTAAFGPVDGSVIHAQGVGTVSGERVYKISFILPSDEITGIWELKELRFGGIKERVITVNKRVVFDVLPATGVVYPSSAEVSINLDQKQLLRREAERLQKQIHEFKSELLKGSRDSKLTETLLRNVTVSIEALDKTGSSFRTLSTDASIREASTIFFGDLRRSYEDAAETVREHSPVAARQRALDRSPMRLASVELEQTYPLAAHVVLRSLEQNELAYNLVADTGSMWFDLKVESVPAGAAVSLRRKGDPYKKHSEPTNTTVNSLVLAVWSVRVEKPGYQPAEVEHDPFTEPNHVVSVELSK